MQTPIDGRKTQNAKTSTKASKAPKRKNNSTPTNRNAHTLLCCFELSNALQSRKNLRNSASSTKHNMPNPKINNETPLNNNTMPKTIDTQHSPHPKKIKPCQTKELGTNSCQHSGTQNHVTTNQNQPPAANNTTTLRTTSKSNSKQATHHHHSKTNSMPHTKTSATTKYPGETTPNSIHSTTTKTKTPATKPPGTNIAKTATTITTTQTANTSTA